MFVGLRRADGWWSDVDTLLAQAWSDVERQKCPDCGTPLWQAFDPALEMAWEVDLPTRCHPCTAISEKSKPYVENEQVRAPHALRFGARLRA